MSNEIDLELKKRFMVYCLNKAMELNKLPTSIKPDPENSRHLKPWKYYVTDLAVMFTENNVGLE